MRARLREGPPRGARRRTPHCSIPGAGDGAASGAREVRRERVGLCQQRPRLLAAAAAAAAAREPRREGLEELELLQPDVGKQARRPADGRRLRKAGGAGRRGRRGGRRGGEGVGGGVSKAGRASGAVGRAAAQASVRHGGGP
jgi:hypothetical protein